jgi:osomolarity two-component system sensor histidine kinase SLN1
VSTRLVFPQEEANPPGDVCAVEIQSPSSFNQSPPLSIGSLSEHNLSMETKPHLDWIAVRIEVTDTGCGIRRRDMVESRLFCRSSCQVLFLF